MQLYQTKMDQMVKAITIIIHCAILPIPFYLWVKAGWQMALLNILLMLLIFTAAYLFRPYQYELFPDQIVVRKSLLPKIIQLNHIQSIERVEYKDLKVRLRLWGSGGLWGWYGIFLSSTYGKINLQCTERENLVLIQTHKNHYIVLSPLERDLFLQQLQHNLKSIKSLKS